MRRAQQADTEFEFTRKRLTLALALLASQAMTGYQALAQDDESLEEVVITGSRIRTTGMDMPNPVTVVTREEIDIISPTTLIEGLQYSLGCVRQCREQPGVV